MTFYTDEIVNIYSNLAKIEEIGETFEKRKMYAVRITADPNPKGIRKIYLQCLIHASKLVQCVAFQVDMKWKFVNHLGEWITGPVCMSIAKYLCEEYSKPDADDTKDTEVGIMRPDGLHYTLCILTHAFLGDRFVR